MSRSPNNRVNSSVGTIRAHWATVGLVFFVTTAQAQEAQPPPLNPPVTNPPNSSTNPSTNSTNTSNDVTNASNNPLTPKTQILVQNYFMPSPQGYGGRPANQLLLRLYWPFTVFGAQNIFRVYEPIFTEPLFPHGRDAGLGDTTVFNLTLHKLGEFTVGGGPLLVIPAASHSDMGDGKWQAGVAGSVVTERSWGLLGTIITYSHSFLGVRIGPRTHAGCGGTATRSLQFQ